jgi:A/G-specific adenine glycosylase
LVSTRSATRSRPAGAFRGALILCVVEDPDSLIRLFRQQLRGWGNAHRRAFPWREDRDSFKVLVAELLLQRSRGRTVALVFDELFRRWPDAESLAKARVRAIEAVIRPLGLVRRAASLKELARAVVAAGGVPQTVEGLMKLPGVGRYSASATLAVAFGKRVATVDGVTARVYRRYFHLPADRPPSEDRELWRLVDQVTPTRKVREWNWAVLDLAATVCLPKRPRCPECPLRADCRWSLAHSTDVGS